jgi:hypothetical protein
MSAAEHKRCGVPIDAGRHSHKQPPRTAHTSAPVVAAISVPDASVAIVREEWSAQPDGADDADGAGDDDDEGGWAETELVDR